MSTQPGTNCHLKHQQTDPPGADEMPSSPEEILQNNDFFDTSHLKADLKGRFVRGSAITMLGQASRFVIQTASTVVLARLLSPKDYGLVAMVTAVTGFMMIFKDLGLSTATVQKAQTNHQQISTLFWINVAISTIAMLVTAALAPALAWFYNEPRLTWIGLALSTSFLFVGLSVQHQALLRRQMRFTAIVTRDIASMLIGVVLAIVLAWRGAVYWSLVAMQVGTAISGTIMLWLVCKWRPGLPVRRSGVRSMLHFGLNITGFQIVNYFARNADKVLLGRFYGSYVTGLYSRAYSLFMLPISQIRAPLIAVAIPALSHLQNEATRYARYYYKLSSFIAFVTMPLAGFLFVCSESIIRLLLGEKWMDANIIFKILAVAAFIQAVENTRGLTLISLGLSKKYLKVGIFTSAFFVLAFAVGVRWGARGVALSYVISEYLIMIPSLWYSFRKTPVSVLGFFKVILRPAVTSLASTAIMFLAYKFLLANQPDFVTVGACLTLGTASYFAIWCLMPGGIQTILEFFSYVSLLRGKNAVNQQ
jgi:PST family polysaccharide transporter